MSIENQIRAFAGTFILLSLALYRFHSHYWIYFTTFVGVNLLQSAFTHFCPLEMLLLKFKSSEKRLP
jgi:hypothetical protein